MPKLYQQKSGLNLYDMKSIAMEIFSTGLRSADPYEAVLRGGNDVRAFMDAGGYLRLVVAAFGKAACAMACAAEDLFGDLIEAGIIITKYDHCSTSVFPKVREGEEDEGKFSIFEAGHPIPDENGAKATEKIIRLVRHADEKTLVLCLISGGGSSLLVSPGEGITLADKQRVTDLFLKAGADIGELNSIRKHLSLTKGGRLAAIAQPAGVLSLIISDVIGNKLDVIASGPTAPDSSTYQDSLTVIEKYGLTGSIPPSVAEVLRRGAEGLIPETPKPDDPLFSRVKNVIIADNIAVLEGAGQRAKEMGFATRILSAEVRGEARQVAKWLAVKAMETRQGLGKKQSFCLISGGETTVTVSGNGRGGRNMELALAFALEIQGVDGITVLSAGTDGTDGPTDAAGAIANGRTAEKALAEGIDPSAYLVNNDSYTFFQKIGGLVKTGPTGTNVMDIQIILITT